MAKVGGERIDEIEDPEIINLHNLSILTSPTRPITLLALTI